MQERRRIPLWLWPNLLSLDAPVVALVWLAMFAPIAGMNYQPWQAYTALGLVVWGIYVVDRVMDLKFLGRGDHRLKERHLFHGRHFAIMGTLGVGALISGAVIALTSGWPSTLIGGHYFTSNAEVGYIVPGLIMVAGYFVMAITALQDDEIPHLRNLLAGLAFGYGTAMTACVNGSIREGLGELLVWPPMLCFSLLCGINISAIHFWEHSRRATDPDTKAAHELALTFPLCLLAGVTAWLALRENVLLLRGFYAAILTATGLLFLLNRNRSRFSMDALRVLADVALIVPYPVFLSMKGH